MHISIMLVFWSLVRNSVVLAVYFLFSVTCFFTVHEHLDRALKHRDRIHLKWQPSSNSKQLAKTAEYSIICDR